MRKKQVMALMAAAALCCGALGGCGGKKPEGSIKAQNTESQKEETPKSSVSQEEEAGEPVTISWYTWETNYKTEIEAAVEAYEKEHPQINVEVMYVGDTNSQEYLKKLDVMILGGAEMDVIMQASMAQHSARAESGTFLPLDDYMKEEGITMGDEYVIDSPVNGSYYGLPGDLKSWYVILNKNDLDAAGLPVPSFDWTWQDYKEYAVKLTHGEGASKHYGSFMQAGNDRYSYLPIWVEKQDNPYFKDADTLNFDDPLFKEFLELRYDMEAVSKCQVGIADVKALNMNYRNEFFNGNVSMLPIGTYTLADIANQDKYPHDFVTTFAPIPRWDTDTEPGRTITESLYYTISKTSTHPKEAYDFIRWMTTEGYKYKVSSTSAEKGVDRFGSFKNSLSEDSHRYYDLEALENLLNNEKWKDNFYTITPGYQSRLEALMKEETETYLLGGQSIDDTIANLKSKGAEIQKEFGSKEK